MPIGSCEHAGGNAGWVVIAGLLRDLAIGQITHRLEIEHEDLGLQQRRLDRLPQP